MTSSGGCVGLELDRPASTLIVLTVFVFGTRPLGNFFFGAARFFLVFFALVMGRGWWPRIREARPDSPRAVRCRRP